MCHDHPVLAGERDHVGHGGDRGKFEEGFAHALHLGIGPAEGREQSLHHFESHTGAAKILFGVRAIRTIGIEDGERRRQCQSSGR